MKNAARKIHIIGAGAIGTYLAYLFAKAGLKVCLIARGERLAAIRQHGLCVAGEPETVSVPTDTKVGDLEPDDIVIVAIKTNGIAEVAAMLGRCRGSGYTILTLQNGVETPAILAQSAPTAGILAGRVHGFFELSEGQVHHKGVDLSVAFGPLPTIAGGNGPLVLNCLSRASIAGSYHEDALPLLWEKLVLTSSIGGLGAVLDKSAGQIFENPDHRRTLEAAMIEVVELARALAVELPTDVVARQMAFVAQFPYGACSSMQRDLLARKPSEFDHLTGAVVRLAAQAQVAVPCHIAIVEGLKVRKSL